MKNRYRNYSVLASIFLLFYISPTMAGSLYQQHVERATISEKAINKSLKQVKNYREINIIDELSMPPFHKRTTIQTTTKKPFCTTCHLPLPHQKNERNRTFMNMHSHYIACETCHFRPEKIELDYRWMAYDGIAAGNILPPRPVLEITIEITDPIEREHTAQFKKRIPLAPQPGARISPFYENSSVPLFKENIFSKEIEKKWKDANDNKRAEIKAKLHAPLKEKGPACKECHHKDKKILDLEALGATPIQIKAIQNNIIVRFFDRFKKEDDRIRIDKLLR